MKKTIVTLVALCAAIAVNATVLRVSNVSGSTAPYSTIEDALAAAAEGDTIMLDASAKDYGKIKIDKRIALIGPGYWLQENGIIQEGGGRSWFDNTITVEASGVILQGLYIAYNVVVKKNCTDVVIKRCCIKNGGIVLESGADRCVIHQNWIRDKIGEGGSYLQITNNIIWDYADLITIQGAKNSYVAYNTFLGKKDGVRFWDCDNSTVEKNIGVQFRDTGTSCSILDNMTYSNPIEAGSLIDSDVQALNLSTTHGAFAGDSPYVISGVPSAPVIEDLVVPTTVEYGTKMNVTIKVSVQK